MAKGFKGCAQQHTDLSNRDLVFGQLNHLSNFENMYLQGADFPVRFVACGKDEELDADMNYSLLQPTGSSQEQYQYVPPRQLPINPPYSEYKKLAKI